MRIAVRLILAITILFAIVFGVIIWIGTAKWNSMTSDMVAELHEAAGLKVKTVSFKDFDHLPAPVARYLRRALTDGQACVLTARVSQGGEFLTSQENEAWRPFTAMEHFTASPPAYVWDAHIRMALLMRLRVRDGYQAGKGSMEAEANGVIPVFDEKGGQELNSGSLQRYLAEAVWFPTALIPGAGVTWSAIDATSARATLTDGKTTVSVIYHFDKQGDVTDITSPGRYREVEGKFVLTPWEVRVWDYVEQDGMRTPRAGEAAWLLPQGRQRYWKGKITDVQYEFLQ